MHDKSPDDYLKELNELLKREVEKIEAFKHECIESNQYEIASQFRDIQKKILDFASELKATK